MKSVAFGTDGIRGVAGSHPITEEVAKRLGAAVVAVHGTLSPRLLVATDTRDSGPSLAMAVCEGALRQGARVTSVGVWPTPAVGCALAADQADVAVIVTASHNPAADNGFKIMVQGGRKPKPDQLRALEQRIAGTPPPAHKTGTMLPPLKPDAWWNALSQGLGPLSGLAGRRIAVDFANGAGQLAATWLQENVAGDWSLAAPPSANINDRCGSEHLEHLSRVVREGSFDAGLALDGDGDRCRLVGPHGESLPGDAVLWLLANDSSAERIAVTVMSNMGLEASLPNTHVLRTPVGDAHIEAALRAPGVPLGGEESGHIRFVDHPTGDGLFAGLRALDAAFRNGGLVRAIEGYTPYATTQFKIAVTARPSLTEHPVIAPMVGEVERRLNGEGRIFLRYSGTEPVLRVLIEAASQRLVNALAGEVRDVLKKVFG